MKLFPEKIKKIAFVAISGPPDMERIKFSSDYLKACGYDVIIKTNISQSNPVKYLSGDIHSRVSDIHSCWQNNEIDMIIASRGGYGSAHILPFIDWNLLAKRKIPFIGYSDLTAFHLAKTAKKTGSPVSGPMAHNFQHIHEDTYTISSLKDTFLKNQPITPFNKSKPFIILKKGNNSGKIYPVTLSVLVTLIGTPWLPDLTNAILLLEDINEPVYKLDRYFTQLEQSGILTALSGLLIGSFTRCGNAKERYQLLKGISEKINGPVIMNIPFGHTYPRISVAFESLCMIETASRTVKITLDNSRTLI